MTNHLQVGIDFSHRRADVCVMRSDGQLLEAHLPCANNLPGYQQVKSLLLAALAQDEQVDGLDISGEATGYYWLPFFQQLYHDPDLQGQELNLFLLNPRWVRWFKKCFAQDDKSDQKDPFYIAERSRTHPPAVAWQPLATMPLRFYTRYRFHLGQNLTREKNYFVALLFLKASAYLQLRPFSNTFGVTSSHILSQQFDLATLADLPAEALADLLADLSQHKLPQPDSTADKLHQAIDYSFPLAPDLAGPVQTVLDATLAHIRFLQQQAHQLEANIATALIDFPAIQQLQTIPGLGLVLAASIGAEIGDTDRFLLGRKWDKRRKRYRPRTLRDAEDAVAKLAGLWWPKNDSGDFVAQDRHLAKTGNAYLRYFVVQAADKMRHHIPEYAQFYRRKFQEVSKHQHKRALVLTARKSLGLFVGLLHRNEPFRSKEVA